MNATETTTIGSTQVTVSRLGLGTNPLGGMFEAVPEDEAIATVADALHAGLRLFDTAPVYGYGNAERAVGIALAGAARESVTVTTKVGRLLRPHEASGERDTSVLFEGHPLYRGTPDLEPRWDFSYDGAMRSLEESLVRIGMDRVDAVYVHDPDDQIQEAAEGACKALAKLKDEGVIGAIGVGCNSTRALVAMANRAPLDCVLVAGRYSLMDQEATDELLPLCVRDGISVVAGGVYNSGLLCHPEPRQLIDKTDKSASAIPTWRGSATFNYTPASRERIEQAQVLADACHEFGVPLMAAAIQFPLRHPAVASVLMGPRNRVELRQNLEMFEFPIPDEMWDELRRRNLIGAIEGSR
ncbi:MAG: aldo/keto reductase [Pseudolysinimonas sp.]|uniref:aldo/keto reductase n=1 Tax=Pseudolysinimonas sp. TaxID=2680009 RepID=UPI003C7127C3